MEKRYFLYLPNSIDSGNAGAIIDLERASWARDGLARLEAISEWLKSPAVDALKDAPIEIREATFRPRFEFFNFCAVNQWEMDRRLEKHAGEPIASTGYPFEPRIPQLLDGKEAQALLGLERFDCIEPGQYGSDCFVANGMLVVDAPRSKNPEEDGFNTCEISVQELRQVLAPALQEAEAQDEAAGPSPR